MLDLLTEIYSSFEPFQPPSKEAYVDCQEVRGGWEVVRELGRKITRSKKPTCQLYSGHRGVGKSTELLRLKEYLEQQKYFVVYFAADDEDIEPQDAEYADILFACTRHLVEAIKLQNHNPLLDWLKNRGEFLRDLALTELSFEGLNLEGQAAQFGKITANLRANPDKRRELRQKINANTPSLVEALNDFIKEAEKSLPADCRGIVMMADNLDKIAETKEEGTPSNYDEIYLNRSEILRGLACHVIYTVPIAMVYSGRATQLEDNYEKTNILPMVMVKNPDGTVNSNGLGKLREIICRRLEAIDSRLTQTMDGTVAGLDLPAVFDSSNTLNHLCIMSGGHARNLMQMIRIALNWRDELPISAEAVQRAIAETRETYLNAIQEHQWEILADVYCTKQANNNEQFLRLLLTRCLLEYRYYDKGKLKRWYDVHPLIEEIEQFQAAVAKRRQLPS